MEANSDLQLVFRSSIAEQGVYICSSNQAYIRVRPALISLTHKKTKSGPSGYTSLRDLLLIKLEIQQTQKAKRLAYQGCTIKLTPSKYQLLRYCRCHSAVHNATKLDNS